MPVDFDPEWEYWNPDPEIAYAMSTPISRRDLISEFYADVRRDGFTCGMRFGCGDPNYSRTRLAPERHKTNERQAYAETKYCSNCKKSYTATRRKQVYCSRECFYVCAGAPREIQDIPCHVCGKVFRPKRHTARFCGRACFGKHYKENVAPTKEKMFDKIDQMLFSKMYLSGTPIKEMEKYFNAESSTIQKWRRRLNLPARPTGSPKRVIQHSQ